ncbi:hypothetical protein [Massilia sp. AB1]|uniref:hypothetical protein n=1 Tax=Massilia sp. AB1 TaxID=2823371 RepID=UPI001B844D9E|nr:hypothetical protein [Massilia sp. AB1]MBQ5941478.1 hypothetical protein [Massilia sp. AB1]
MTNSRQCGVVSRLGFPLPLWRNLLLFQSYRQLQSWILIVVGTVWLVCFATRFFASHMLPIGVALMGVSCGALISVAMSIPAEFHVLRRPERLTGLLASRLQYLGYMELSSTGDVIVYRQRGPRCLRWDESNVRVREYPDKIVVRGAWFIVADLRRWIQREEGAA